MKDQLQKTIRRNFEHKTISELRRIITQRDTGEWSEDAIRVAEELLDERPDEPYDDSALVEVIGNHASGRVVFELTHTEVAGYRIKIQILGWLLCIVGVLVSIIFFMPMTYGAFNSGSVIFGILGVIVGFLFVFTGVGLIRLNPRARINGLILSLLLLPFFPIGTVIGFCAIFWLGKRGGVLNAPVISNQTGTN